MTVMTGRGVAKGTVSAVVTVAAGTPWAREFECGIIANGSPPSILQFQEWWDWHRDARQNARRIRAVNREMAAYRKQIAREGYVPPAS